MPAIDRSFFARSALDVAKDMIGLEMRMAGVGGKIVETEAYLPDDPASHSFIGKRQRNRSMWEKPGTAYVYRIYGMHFCLNAVCLPGSAVLIRALEPTREVKLMRQRRKVANDRLLCSGPGRLAQALEISLRHDGMDMLQQPFDLLGGGAAQTVQTSGRIGITKAANQPWRFGLQGSPYLSKKL